MNNPKLNKIMNTLESFAYGKFTEKIVCAESSDPLDQIAISINKLGEKLTDLYLQKETKQAYDSCKTENKELVFASEISQRHLFDMPNSSFWGIDTISKKMLYASPGTENIYGFSEEEFIDNPNLWIEVIVSDDKKIVDQIYAEIKNGISSLSQYRILHKDGNIKWIEVRMNPTMDEKGKLIRIDGISLDITDRKKTEQELKAVSERFELVLKATDDAIWDWDLLSGKVFRSKDGLKKVYGFDDNTEIESIDKWLDRIHPDDMDATKQLMTEIFQSVTKEVFSCEYRFLRPDNRYVNVLDRGYIIRDKVGKPIRMIGAAQDITTRIISKNIIKESEKQWRQLLKAIPNIVLKINRDLKVSYINQVAEGFSMDDVLGSSIFNFIPPEEHENVKQIYDEIFRTGKKMRYEIMGYDLEQQVRWYRSTADILNHEAEEKEIIIVTDDITDRKNVEIELKISEERFDLALEGSNDGLWDWNLLTGEIYFSPRWACMIGYKVHEIPGTLYSWESLVHPDDLPKVTKVLDSYLKGKLKKYQVEFRMIHKKGHHVHILARGQALKDTSGTFYRMIGTNLDISEQKKNEALIAQSINELKLIDQLNKASLNNVTRKELAQQTLDAFGKLIPISGSGFYLYAERSNSLNLLHETLNKDLVFSLGNKQEIRLTKIISQLKKKSYFTMVIENKKVLALKDRKEMLKVLFELTGISKIKPFSELAKELSKIKSILIVPIILNNKISGIMAHCLNVVLNDEQFNQIDRFNKQITTALAKLAVEDEVVKSKERYQTLVENLNEAIILDDIDGKVVYANDRFLDFFGLKREDLSNLILEDYISPEYRSLIRERHNRRMAGESVAELFEYEGLLKDGSKKWFEVRVSKVIEHGEIQGSQSAIRDITERKNAENKLIQLNEELRTHAKELAFSNAELEQFAFVASHDLQEPLRMITSFLSLLEKKYDPIFDEKGKQYIYFATDGAKRMRHIILSLLEYSRVGKIEESKEEINLEELIEGILILNRKKIQEKKAHVHYGKLPKLYMAKAPIQQLFQNLISNGLKYQLNDNIPEIHINAYEEPDFWKFEVRDNGIGIDPEYFEKIFTIFQRLHDRDEYSGTGIGLAICKKIVENSGGKIWVDSKKNIGTSIYFTFPKQK